MLVYYKRHARLWSRLEDIDLHTPLVDIIEL